MICAPVVKHYMDKDNLWFHYVAMLLDRYKSMPNDNQLQHMHHHILFSHLQGRMSYILSERWCERGLNLKSWV